MSSYGQVTNGEGRHQILGGSGLAGGCVGGCIRTGVKLRSGNQWGREASGIGRFRVHV